jgi:HSP20 family molecular chaperone IbpA
MKTSTPAVLFPAGNFYRTAEGALLELELPGVCLENLEVELKNGRLLVRGRRSQSQSAGRELLSETALGTYQREFHVDPSLDGDRIIAELRDGILSISLPRRESVHRIPVL